MLEAGSGIIRRIRSSGRRTIPAVCMLAAAVVACSSDTGPESSVELNGAPVSVGNGTAHAYVVTSPGGIASIGVALTPAALQGLPATDTMWDLPLPPGTVAPPWDHVE